MVHITSAIRNLGVVWRATSADKEARELARQQLIHIAHNESDQARTMAETELRNGGQPYIASGPCPCKSCGQRIQKTDMPNLPAGLVAVGGGSPVKYPLKPVAPVPPPDNYLPVKNTYVYKSIFRKP